MVLVALRNDQALSKTSLIDFYSSIISIISSFLPNANAAKSGQEKALYLAAEQAEMASMKTVGGMNDAGFYDSPSGASLSDFDHDAAEVEGSS